MHIHRTYYQYLITIILHVIIPFVVKQCRAYFLASNSENKHVLMKVEDREQ